MNERPRHLDLFSGIGGFSLAFEAEGFETIGFSEVNPYACRVLKRHWPNVVNYGNIKNVKAVQCDVITGGFPCQPFSFAGKRRGASDDRALWPEMCRVIAECRPAWVLGENVPGIISMELDRVLSDLENIGYSAWPIVVPACAVDAKHRRSRVWIVAYAGGNSRRGIREKRQDNNLWQETAPNCSQCKSWPGQNGATVADSDQPRLEKRSEQPARQEFQTIERSGEIVSDTSTNGRNERNKNTGRNGEGTTETQERTGLTDFHRWQPEPELGRVAHGIPNRSHRLRGLGNAIVPQVAQVFARAIKELMQ